MSTTVEAHDARRTNWLWIDNEVITTYGAEIGATGIALYCALAMYADNETRKCWPSKDTLAQQIGVSVKTMEKYLGRLVDAKLVGVKARHDKDGRQTSNAYWLLPVQKTGGRGVNPIPPEGSQKRPPNYTHSEPDETEEPNGSSVRASRPRKKSPWHDPAITRLRSAFEIASGIERPVPKQRRDYAQDRVLWSGPLCAIMDIAKSDVSEAEGLIIATVKKLRGQGMTVASPKSIVNTARSIAGTRATGAEADPLAEQKTTITTWLGRRGGDGNGSNGGPGVRAAFRQLAGPHNSTGDSKSVRGDVPGHSGPHADDGNGTVDRNAKVVAASGRLATDGQTDRVGAIGASVAERGLGARPGLGSSSARNGEESIEKSARASP